MKIIYEALYPIGYKEHEVADNFTIEVPYTSVKPLELENQQSQFYDFAERVWKEAVTQDYSAKLELLENLNVGLQSTSNQLKSENESLKQVNANHDQQITDTQLALAEVFESVNAPEGGK